MREQNHRKVLNAIKGWKLFIVMCCSMALTIKLYLDHEKLRRGWGKENKEEKGDRKYEGRWKNKFKFIKFFPSYFPKFVSLLKEWRIWKYVFK